MDKQTLQKVIAFRQLIHQHPETTFEQFETHNRIKNYLLELGVPKQAIRQVNREGHKPTGLIVDLQGKAEAKGKNICVAFRADIDALPMTELSYNLPYVSKNVGKAHMCGHDGHIACLIGFVPLFLKEEANIPKNKKIRLLFQPAEQTVTGAKFMVEQGCLEGVDEVYGFHNWPVGKFGDIWCKEGPVMARATSIRINIIGDGGHGSSPEGLKVAIWEGIRFHTQMKNYVDYLHSVEKRQFACTFPVFHAGERFNVIGESARVQGTLRTFDNETQNKVIHKIQQLLSSIQKKGFKVAKDIKSFELTSNTKKEAENVIRVAKEYLGEDKVSAGTLPFRASEDFGVYTQHRPGAFFFFCTKKTEDQVFLHNPRFNFKDELIETAAVFWLKLAQDRINSV